MHRKEAEALRLELAQIRCRCTCGAATAEKVLLPHDAADTAGWLAIVEVSALSPLEQVKQVQLSDEVKGDLKFCKRI